MRKPEVDSRSARKQPDVSGRQQPCRSVSNSDAQDPLGDALMSKPEYLGMERLLPFLHERIAFKMPSDLAYLDDVLDYLNERMLKLGVLKPGDSDLLIALDEAIVNSIKHGNKCDPRKAVHVVAEFDADGARFTIVDEGPGFAREKVPDPTDPCRLLEPSGRGLLLINHIMDEVCYNQASKRLEMSKRVDRVHNQVSAADDSQIKPQEG